MTKPLEDFLGLSFTNCFPSLLMVVNTQVHKIIMIVPLFASDFQLLLLHQALKFYTYLLILDHLKQLSTYCLSESIQRLITRWTMIDVAGIASVEIFERWLNLSLTSFAYIVGGSIHWSCLNSIFMGTILIIRLIHF